MRHSLRKGLPVSVIVVALAVAGAGAVFALLRAALLHPYVDPAAGDLVVLHAATTKDPGRLMPPSLPDVADISERTSTLDDVAAWYEQTLTLTTPEGATTIRVAFTSPNLFGVLRVRFGLGPGFSEDVNGTAIVSYGFWRTHMASSSALEGESIVVNNRSVDVVGVLEPGFHLPGSTVDVWMASSIVNTRGLRSARAYTKVIARLRPGSTLEAARLDVDRISRSLEEEYPASNQFWRIDVQRFDEYLLGASRQTMRIFFWLSVLVLVLATVTLSNTLVARTLTRSRNIGIRLLLGARPLRIVGGEMAALFAIVAATTALAVPLAAFLTQVVVNTADNASIFRLAEPGSAALAALAGCAIVPIAPGGALFALITAMIRRPPIDARTAGSLGRVGSIVARPGLAIQIAITFCLFATSMAVGASWRALRSARPGFDSENLLTARTNLIRSDAAAPEARLRRFREIVDSARAVAGVRNVTLASVVPFANDLLDFTVELSSPEAPDLQPLTSSYRAVDEGYFGVMGSHILAGRDFASTDDSSATPAIIVNEAFARRWPGPAALVGQTVTMQYTTDERRLIVGVVEDVVTTEHPDPEPTVYVPLGQLAFVFAELTLVARIQPDLFDLAELRTSLDRLTGGFPVHEIRTIDSLRHDSLARHRILSMSAIALATIAMLVAALGVVGLLRVHFKREAGSLAVRRVLGATTGRLARESLNRVLLPAVSGTFIGALAIYLSGPFLSLSSGLEAAGPWRLIPAGLIGVALSTAAGFAVPIRELSSMAIVSRINAE